jgi:hypothetical protein
LKELMKIVFDTCLSRGNIGKLDYPKIMEEDIAQQLLMKYHLCQNRILALILYLNAS